ncbi:hypothetical protein INR49_017101 [Caranx melampygus]|nr:hypothetical protein INR49_017101 [Caranx melampygus]
MSNGRDTDELNEEDIDEDELLAMLSPEELKELQSEMDVIIAPDETVPVGQRQKDQTEKAPTGTFDHRSLVDYLYWEKESKRMLEEERVPATLLPSEEIIEEIIEEIVEEVDESDEKDKEVDVKDEEVSVNKDKNENVDKSVCPLDDTETVTQNKTDENQLLPNTKKTESLAPERSTSHVEEKEEIKSTDLLLPKDPPEEPEINESDEKLPPKEERKINKLKIPKLALNNIKMTSRPSGNETNLDSTLDKIRKNNPSVTEVNLNNIENIPKEMLWTTSTP